MQQAVGLFGARIHGHGPAQPVVAGFGDADAEVFDQRTAGAGIDGADIDWTAESHGGAFGSE